MSFKIYKNLALLNGLPQAEAERLFVGCCRAPEWARQMAEARPFAMVEDVFETAGRIWFSLSEADRRGAFAVESDPSANKINSGQRRGHNQTGVKMAIDAVRAELVEANRLYEDKFGFIFILNADGKTADEILSVCRARLGNSLQTELTIATEEQRKITEAGLSNLLEK